MSITKRKSFVMAVGLFALVALTQVALETLADARAGGGRSGGFRGSRSSQAPSRATNPTAPQRQDAMPAQQARQPSSMMPQSGGFMRGLGTAVLGGFLGSMLFSGLAGASGFGGMGGGMGGSGFGMLEILLFGGLAYFLYRKYKASKTPALATSGGSMQYQDTSYQAPAPGYSNNPPVQEPLPLNSTDYRSLTLMDPSFDANKFLKTAQDNFFKIQGAWNKQDVTALRTLCGGELMKTWEAELAQLKLRGQKNRMDNIALRESEITEVWTESGEDFITVRLHANLLDFTVDEKSGNVVVGSDSEPVEFEEFWTYSRPVGPNGWKLTAVQQA
ncbi:MAG TPA: TIM44-like domain-containing protein [Candidatus Limnocylindria bacterium]|nr:TIM44-like domain-containing protein [Candidatus Limnocylindria bacterium]